MKDKTVVITGVTGAIGKATALELAQLDCHVIMLGRNAAKLAAVRDEIVSKSGNAAVEVIVADLSESDSVKAATEQIKARHPRLDALVNVAAIFTKKRTVNSRGLEYMFAANHLGPFVLTTQLLDPLKAGQGRIVTVSAPSTTKVKFDDLQGEKKYSAGFLGAFGASKMMNLLFTYALARRLDAKGVTAVVYHPGLVKSKLTQDMPAILNGIIQLMARRPQKAARMLARLAVDPGTPVVNGSFYKFTGKQMKSRKYSHQEDVQEKLWTVSEELTR